MDIIFAAKTLSSMSFVFFLASYVSLLCKRQPQLFPAFMLICIGVFLCFIFDTRLRSPKARFIPLALVFASLFFITDISSALTVIFAIVYAVIMIVRQSYFLTYGEGADEFKRNIKIILFLLFTSVVFGIVNNIGTSVLPFTIIYMISSVCELSMLRHNDNTLKERRFITLNSLILGFACLLGFFMATSLFMKACSAILGFLWMRIIIPILMAITTVASYVLLGFSNLLSKNVFELLKTKGGKGITFELMGGLVDDNKFTGERNVLDVILAVVAVVVIAITVFVLIKKLMKGRSAPERDKSGSVRYKEYIPRKDKDENMSSEVKGIRHIYRKFLILLESRGLDIPIFFTSYDVNNSIHGEIPDKADAEKLRQYYILARYGEKDMSKDDLKKAKQLYAGMKKKK